MIISPFVIEFYFSDIDSKPCCFIEHPQLLTTPNNKFSGSSFIAGPLQLVVRNKPLLFNCMSEDRLQTFGYALNKYFSEIHFYTFAIYKLTVKCFLFFIIHNNNSSGISINNPDC